MNLKTTPSVDPLLLGGATIVFLGTLAVLGAFGLLDFRVFWQYWSLLLVIAG